MNTKQITIYEYSLPAVEAEIDKLSIELTEDFAPVEAKHDAQREQMITETELQVKLYRRVQTRVQLGIDKGRNLILPATSFFNAKDAEESAKKQCAEKDLQINHCEQQLGPLKRKLTGYTPDPFKEKYGSWLLPVAYGGGAIDCGVGYIGLRNASYPFLLAVAAAIAIGAIISISHIAYCPWIKKASTTTQRNVRALVVLSIALLFFAVLSNLRADAATQVVSLNDGSSDILVQSAPHISKWAVLLISFTLFCVVFFFSLLVWKSKEERQQELEHHKLSKSVTELTTQVSTLKAEIEAINNKVQIEKNEARACHEYLNDVIERMKHVGENAIAIYKHVYAKYHQSVPAFFESSPLIVYEDSFITTQTIKS
jgi:outer membrane murein-binding lipoprotein Lpp